MDQILDIVISPDRLRWQWKDEDELQGAAAMGVYSPETVRAIRAEGERVIGLLKANASPFCDGWEVWAPPREWTMPAFPPAWESYPLAEKVEVNF